MKWLENVIFLHCLRQLKSLFLCPHSNLIFLFVGFLKFVLLLNLSNGVASRTNNGTADVRHIFPIAFKPTIILQLSFDCWRDVQERHRELSKWQLFGLVIIRPIWKKKHHHQSWPSGMVRTYLGRRDRRDRAAWEASVSSTSMERRKRRCRTHTWLRSNQPPAYVLTPFCVPPPPATPRCSSYPVQLLLLRSPSSSDPLLLGVMWTPPLHPLLVVAPFPTLSFLQVFSPLLADACHVLFRIQPFPSPLFLLFTRSAQEKLLWSEHGILKKKKKKTPKTKQTKKKSND